MGERYRSFDAVKGIACIAVILIHYLFPEPFGTPVKTMCRFAVPVFFGISGYFFAKDGRCSTLSTVKKLRHISVLILASGAFYFVFTLLFYPWYQESWTVREFFAERVHTASVIKFFLTNDPFVYSHLWFLLALFYVYLLALLVIRDQGRIRFCLPAGCVLLAGYSLLQEFSSVLGIKNSIWIPGTDRYLYFFNLFIFRALPLFLLGYAMRRDGWRAFCRRIPDLLLVVVLFAGMALSVFERVHTKEVQYFIGNLASAWALMTICIKHPEKGSRALCFIGKELSMYVYILHIAVGRVITGAISKYGISSPAIKALTPVFVIVCTLLVSYLCCIMKHKIQSLQKPRRI